MQSILGNLLPVSEPLTRADRSRLFLRFRVFRLFGDFFPETTTGGHISAQTPKSALFPEIPPQEAISLFGPLWGGVAENAGLSRLLPLWAISSFGPLCSPSSPLHFRGGGGHRAVPRPSLNRRICSAIGRGGAGVFWPFFGSTFSQMRTGPGLERDSAAAARQVSALSKE
jgi:hypothetical protein